MARGIFMGGWNRLFAILLATAETAKGTADFSDRTRWTCDKMEDITLQMTDIVKASTAGMTKGDRLLYVKNGAVETGRSSNEMRCRVTIVTTMSETPQSGIYRVFNQDDRVLSGWQPNRDK